MKPKSIPMLALVSGISLAVAACSGNDNANGADATATDTAAVDTSATPAATGTAAASDHASQFLSNAAMADNGEIKIGQLAADQGSSQEVKDFGKTLVSDHTKSKTQGGQIAMSMGLTPPTDMTPDANAEYTKLQGMKGADFDKEFATFMVNDHQKAIDMFQQEASSSDPAPVTDFAKQTLPTLKMHLEMAQSLQK